MNTLETIWTDYVGKTARQIREEYLSLLALMIKRQAKSVIEIGTWKGGSALGFLSVGAKVTAFDIVQFPETAALRGTYPKDFEFYLRDSRTGPPENLELVDMLHIDGDHSYEGVKSDYEKWKHLVKPGGMIVFHDIKDSKLHVKQNCGVPKFWKEIRGESYEEFLDMREERCGYGVKFV